MRKLHSTVAGIALLLATAGAAFADDTHHAKQPEAPTAEAQPGTTSWGMPMPGMQSQAGMMMNMMSMMSQSDMTPMMAMMGPNGLMTFGMMDSQGRPVLMMSGAANSAMGMPGMSGGLADHVEGRIAFLNAELKITEAQASLWNTYADALRKIAAQARHTRGPGMGGMATVADLPARLASQEQELSDRLDLLRQETQPLLALYAALSDEQKRMADQLLAPGGMGM